MPPLRAAAPLLAAVLAAAGASAAAPGCRCVPPDPCWDAVPWAALNASVGGRLAATVDPMSVCTGGGLNSAACATALNASDNEFWLTAQPGGYLHTGQFSLWNMSSSLSAFVVLAESEDDISAAVAFASAHNLRLAVKGTGHDWYGRSTAPGSLLVWTHLRKGMAFNGSWTPDGGCAAGPPVAAVTVQTGVQFRELYDAAQAAGRVVMGGTCDSVGVGGCWLGGCFGTFSKLYGSAASNLLQARVVLANGTAVLANACTNPDLFWALRGGGGGLAGVVTEFTARTHAPPRWLLEGSGYFATQDARVYQRLLELLLNYSVAVQAPPFGGGVGFGRNPGPASPFYVSMWPRGFEVQQEFLEALFAPLVAYAASLPAGTVTSAVSFSVWNASAWAPGDPVPWEEVHPDREISTALVGSLSKYATLQQLTTEADVAALAAALVNLTLSLPRDTNCLLGIDFEKGQAGASPAALALLADTAQNPILASALGLLLVMLNVPSLPTLPPSATVLAALWPRLQNYIVLSEADPLWAPCAAGAAGDEAQAAACSDLWMSQRVPVLQAQLAAMKATLWEAFPNVSPVDGSPVSGSYWNEADVADPEWQVSHWGAANYARLLSVKDAYDPAGLFVCHHCVGSERWTPDGNCRVNGTLAAAA
jgi:hypothetical protein